MKEEIRKIVDKYTEGNYLMGSNKEKMVNELSSLIANYLLSRVIKVNTRNSKRFLD